MSRYLVEWFFNGELIQHRTVTLNLYQLLDILPTKGYPALNYLQQHIDCIGVYIKDDSIIGGKIVGKICMKITDLLKVQSYEHWLSKHYPNVYYQYLYRNR